MASHPGARHPAFVQRHRGYAWRPDLLGRPGSGYQNRPGSHDRQRHRRNQFRGAHQRAAGAGVRPAQHRITADGSLTRIDRSSEHLSALAVGLGAFGIITRVTVDIEPTYLVRQDVYRFAPWEIVLGQLGEVMASAYSVSLLADFSSPTVMQVWLKTRLGKGEHSEVAPTLFGGTWYDDSDELAPDNVNQRASVPGPWSERMPHFRLDRQPSNGGDELQSEYYVSREHSVQALEVLRTMGAQISPHLLISEIRTAAADSLWLSPAYEQDVLCIGFTWAKHLEEVAALISVIEAALAPFAPRQHWGKLFNFGADVIDQRFPQLADFKAVRKHYDPEGKFWNPFLARTLGAPYWRAIQTPERAQSLLVDHR